MKRFIFWKQFLVVAVFTTMFALGTVPAMAAPTVHAQQVDNVNIAIVTAEESSDEEETPKPRPKPGPRDGGADD